MEEGKDPSETIAEKIIRSLSLDSDSITKEAAVEVLYPQIAILKVEVRLQSSEKWLHSLVSMSDNTAEKIGVTTIAKYLKKINFNDTPKFWKELDRQTSIFKAKVL